MTKWVYWEWLQSGERTSNETRGESERARQKTGIIREAGEPEQVRERRRQLTLVSSSRERESLKRNEGMSTVKAVPLSDERAEKSAATGNSFVAPLRCCVTSAMKVREKSLTSAELRAIESDIRVESPSVSCVDEKDVISIFFGRANWAQGGCG